MQHVWQFHVTFKEDTEGEKKEPIFLNYVTESGRKSKVYKAIMKDLILKASIKPETIEQFLLRQLR